MTSSFQNAVPSIVALATSFLALGGCGGLQNLPAEGAETRQTIRLSPADREHLLRGMQVYLESVQGIVEALPKNKMMLVEEKAKNSGMSMLETVPLTAALDLPPDFAMLSIDTHQKFDALAERAAAGGTKAQLLTELGGILANCTACHAMYRVASNK